MVPGVWPGEIVTIHRAALADLKCGELVLFRRDGRFVIHRAVNFAAGALTTRGDAMAAADPPVSADQILGRVVSILRGDANREPVRVPGLQARLFGWMVRHSRLAMRLALRLHALGPRFRPRVRDEDLSWT